MSLAEQYNTDVTINGKVYALDFVDNYLDAKTNETVTKKRWIAADRSYEFTYKRTPLPPRPAAVAAPSAKPGKAKTAPELAPPLDDDTAPAIALDEPPKTGLNLGRFFGGKGKKKAK